MSIFVATTALTDFWDREQEIVFLGPWCRRYDRRIDWQSLRHTTMPSPWDDRKRFYEAAAYLDACGERMVIRLADFLNAVHRRSYTVRYWRIVIGPWLVVFLHSLYDRYGLVLAALDHFPNFVTTTLDRSSFHVPPDTGTATSWLCGDGYNLQIFSQILTALGCAFPSRQAPETVFPHVARSAQPRSRSRRLLAGASGRLARLVDVAVPRRQRIALHGTSIPTLTVWGLSLRSGFGVVPLSAIGDEPGDAAAPTFDARRSGLGSLEATDAFERILVEMLPQHFPTLYLEGYERLQQKAHRRHRSGARTIVSETGWYGSETFKHFAAAAAERQVRLVASQHGLAYGTYRFMPYRLHESRFSDRFLSWGWAEGDAGHRNWPSPQLSQIGTRRSQPRGLLLVTTGPVRYLHLFHSSPVGGQWEEYLDWQERYVGSLPSRYRSALRLRPHLLDSEHAGWQRVADRFPEVRRSDEASVARDLARTAVVVIDHPGSTFAEALRADAPTIAFWNSDRWEMGERAAADFEELRRVGIVWDSPEDAAAKTIAVSDDPKRWWEQHDVRAARGRFVSRYAAASRNWRAFWSKRLNDACAPADSN